MVLIDNQNWQALYDRLVGRDVLIVKPVRDTERFILSKAFEVNPDEQGRIVIPETLIEYSKFKEDIYFVGTGDRVEVWSKEMWERKEKEIVEEADKYIEELSKKK